MISFLRHVGFLFYIHINVPLFASNEKYLQNNTKLILNGTFMNHVKLHAYNNIFWDVRISFLNARKDTEADSVSLQHETDPSEEPQP